VQQRLQPFFLQGGAELQDPESYQSKALARTEEQVGIQTASVAKTVQYYALYCIYNATNQVPNIITRNDDRFDNINFFPAWIDAEGWESNTIDPCQGGWNGVECEDDQVTAIDLFTNRLTGSFPREVILLAADGELASGAGNLNRIDLFDNEFLFNNFDNSWWELLGSNFEFLFFQSTSFAGSLDRLPPNIFELDCSFSLIEGGLVDENFDGLNRLNWMLMDGNAYNSSVPSALGRLPNLEFLYIADAFVSGDLSYMEGMPSIVEHWVDINPELGGSIPTFVGLLSTLISFSITENNVRGTLPTELGRLLDMEQMWFYANQITGQIPSELGELSIMNLLQVEGNMLTGDMPSEICANSKDNFGLLDVIGADCAELTTCTCCTCCSFAECNPGLLG